MHFRLHQPLRDSLEVAHPLERVERNVSVAVYNYLIGNPEIVWMTSINFFQRIQSEFQRNMNMMRDIQGIHAPLRIAMELKAFKNVGRLPFLPSSNLSRDVILGLDESIDFCDILNPPEVHEKLFRPHIVMERKLNLL